MSKLACRSITSVGKQELSHEHNQILLTSFTLKIIITNEVRSYNYWKNSFIEKANKTSNNKNYHLML